MSTHDAPRGDTATGAGGWPSVGGHHPSVPRRDVAAALEAARELGPDYAPAVADNLVEQVGRSIDARVDALTERHLAERRPPSGDFGTVLLRLGSMGMAIPLTAIPAQNLHGFAAFASIAVAWGGIVAVNVSHSLRGAGGAEPATRRRHRARPRELAGPPPPRRTP